MKVLSLSCVATIDSKNPNLTASTEYHVVGIDDENYRIYNDAKEPVLYPKYLFSVTDDTIPDDWVRTDFEDGEYYIESPVTSSDGFYEKYFDGDEKIKLKFNDYLKSII